jgi:hypothetical protein
MMAKVRGSMRKQSGIGKTMMAKATTQQTAKWARGKQSK